MKTLIIGIDPGDRWTGVAQLYIQKDSIIVGTFVIDNKNRTINEIVKMALLDRPAWTVCEEYRARPVGFNRFTMPLTPRLIGALEYRTRELEGEWTTAQAGPPAGLFAFPIGRLIRVWKERWPRESDSRWEHALSAWRVLCVGIMREQPQLHQLIGKVKSSIGGYSTMMLDEVVPSNVDLIAPFASWTR